MSANLNELKTNIIEQALEKAVRPYRRVAVLSVAFAATTAITAAAIVISKSKDDYDPFAKPYGM